MRGKTAKVPADVAFRTKPQIVLSQIAATLAEGEAPVVQVRAPAEGLGVDAWQEMIWREGRAEELRSRFVALRVRP